MLQFKETLNKTKTSLALFLIGSCVLSLLLLLFPLRIEAGLQAGSRLGQLAKRYKDYSIQCRRLIEFYILYDLQC